MALDFFIRRSRVSARPHAAIQPDDKVQFFNQFATVLRAGMPLLNALRLCGEQSRSTRLADVIRTLARRCSGGASLHKAMESHSRIFEHQWIQVVRTGELSGHLAEVVFQLAEHINESRQLRGKIVSAMVYPAMLAAVSLGALVVMLTVVVPTFQELFDSMGGTLPGITQAVIDLSDLLQRRGLLLGAGAVAVAVGGRFVLRSRPGRAATTAVLMCVPLVGDLVVQSVMQSFAMNLALLLRSGTSLLEALGIVRSMLSSNPIYAEAIGRVEQRVRSGGALADALDRSGLFAPLVVSMVRVGEESGRLPEVLDQVSSYYKQKVSALIARLMALMEPLIVVLMGGAVAILLMAIYLPMFNMAGGVH